MTVDLIITQLAVVFLPGLLWARLDARYASKSRPSDTELLVRSLLFGLTSYAVVFVAYSLFGWRFDLIDLGNAEDRMVLTRAVADEMLLGLAAGMALSVAWVYGANGKWLPWFLQKIGATKKYGDEDVWDFILNSNRPEVEYVHFRDFSNEIVYAGYVDAFSETEKLRELLLRDVEVYNFDGKLLFKKSFIYLARSPENIHMEFPYNPASGDSDE